jgi:Methyltransferase domain
MRFSAASTGLGPFGRLARRLIEGPFSLLARSASLEHNVIDLLDKRAIEESADYIGSHMRRALALRSREELWTYAGSRATAPGLWLEFGVFGGYSVNFLARIAGRTMHGFDSFEGLQDDWQGPGLARGTFDLGGKPPRVRNNVRLVKGWFNETLPAFLAAEQSPVSLLHLDCDTYEATKYVLTEVADRLTPETVTILDDYHGHRGFQEGQFKAWAEFVEARGLNYRYAAFNRHAVAICNVQPTTPQVCNHDSAAALGMAGRSELMPAE